MDEWEIAVSEIEHSKLEISRMLNDAPKHVDIPSSSNNKISLKTEEIISDISLTKINNIYCSTDCNKFTNKLNLKLQNLASTCKCFDLTKNGNNNLTASTMINQKLNESFLNQKKKKIKIRCNSQQTIPFIVEGGSENAQLIYISVVLRVDLINSLNFGDILLTVDNM